MTDIKWMAEGPLRELTANVRRALLDRGVPSSDNTRRTVIEVIARVRTEGDTALRAFAREFDGVELGALEVPRAEWDRALAQLEGRVRGALERAASRIEHVHRAFAPRELAVTTHDGVVVTRRPDAYDQAGVYAPGGRAAYPSSLLMGVVPARVAGVREVIVCSPPSATGTPSDIVLAAAAIGGAHRVFAVGGAGAIAAMAFGTETIPRVDRIVGPGNAFVAEAKLQVMRDVLIDSPAGPSELFVIADDSADPSSVAREVLAQAEHDPHAAVVVVSTDVRWADACARAINNQIVGQRRADVIARALASRGGMLVADVAAAIAFASEYAPEHLLLALRDVDRWSARVRNAGTAFVGAGSSVSFGDYMTGANHVLPTGGYARAYSGLSTHDFVRWTTFQQTDRAAAARLASDTAVLADAEGLPAHASAALHWSTE
ncbi:MAG TPA: histidinol dehydrogenase [Gemmatimonadaceae bacterium]|nr:histidinol dehydrogenase [Gemmatimonadaceae bacterium]